VHWVIFNLPADKSELPEGVPAKGTETRHRRVDLAEAVPPGIRPSGTMPPIFSSFRGGKAAPPA
jgi:hypothetical protein